MVFCAFDGLSSIRRGLFRSPLFAALSAPIFLQRLALGIWQQIITQIMVSTVILAQVGIQEKL